MYLLIVLLPFLGFLSAGGFGRFLGSRGAALLSTTLCVFVQHFYHVLHFMKWLIQDVLVIFKELHGFHQNFLMHLGDFYLIV
jgi:hypothetical protein